MDSTGAEKLRLVNKARWKGYGPASVAFADKDVPVKPPAIVEEARHLTNPELVEKVAKVRLRVVTRVGMGHVLKAGMGSCSRHDLCGQGWRSTTRLALRRNARSKSEQPQSQSMKDCLFMVLGSSKLVMPLVAYIFSDGPWRDTFIRLGYDPRLPENKEESYLYQRLYFRNTIHEVCFATFSPPVLTSNPPRCVARSSKSAQAQHVKALV